MLQPESSGAPMSPRARIRAAEALLRAHRAEIVASVVRQAEAGNRAAMRLARDHGLPVGPPPHVLAARLAVSIERTRATVATLLAEGGIARPTPSPAIACTEVKTRHRAGSPVPPSDEWGGGPVNNNENTSAEANSDAASFERTR